VEVVGVTAGASTPEFLVQQVVQRLCEIGGPQSVVEPLAHVDEGVSFKLPSELRDLSA
jgi:4-hydroxy-3-methylbut-2-enyl diphosphate reductase